MDQITFLILSHLFIYYSDGQDNKFSAGLFVVTFKFDPITANNNGQSEIFKKSRTRTIYSSLRIQVG